MPRGSTTFELNKLSVEIKGQLQQQWKKVKDGVYLVPNKSVNSQKIMTPQQYYDVAVPVTIATPERSFSSLKRIKTYLRSSTGQNRLNGLAHLSIHREIPITVDEVTTKFAEKNRTLPL